jgi:hypothetical protein
VWIATGRGKSLGLLEEDQWPFILVDRLFLEGITLCAGEEVDEVVGRVAWQGVDGIGEVGDWVSEVSLCFRVPVLQ